MHIIFSRNEIILSCHVHNFIILSHIIISHKYSSYSTYIAVTIGFTSTYYFATVGMTKILLNISVLEGVVSRNITLSVSTRDIIPICKC